MSTMDDDLREALTALLKQIEDGREFPDAAHDVARKHDINQAELEAAYDDHCADPNKWEREADLEGADHGDVVDKMLDLAHDLREVAHALPGSPHIGLFAELVTMSDDLRHMAERLSSL